MAALALLDDQVTKAAKDIQGNRTPSPVQREILVSRVQQDFKADQDQLATLVHQDMALLDFQELREMMGYLACQDCLEFQAKKGNLATTMPKDFLVHLVLKVALAHLEAEVIMECQVPQEHQVRQARKGREVT